MAYGTLKADKIQTSTKLVTIDSLGTGTPGPISFNDLTNKPTTLTGYGITDGASTSDAVAMALIFG
jgi:hypothetical protein